ncbi:MAG: hypothetical protein U9P42_10830 [Candidatus Fermentibacteria bacterium]|nr:hypothetical protein [Candidatus Fermentibacteria bacterium]
MKKRVLAILTATILLVLIACGDDTTGPSNVGDWFPLSLNNWWNSEMDGYWISTEQDSIIWTGSFEGRITDLLEHSSGFPVYEYRVYMTLNNTLNDSTWTTVDTTYSYLQVTDEELRCFDDTTSAEYEIWLKFPVTLDETWAHADSSDRTMQVIDLDATITVAAGTFSNCVVVRETDTMGSNFYFVDNYYHRGIGLVKTIVSVSTESIYAEVDLQSYNTQ